MDDPRNNWQPVAELAELEQVHESTIRRNAVSIDELAGEEVYEQRPATMTERRRHRVSLMFRLRPVYAVVEQRRQESERPDLRDVTISWEQFAVEHEGETYLSLRKMVEVGGLYAQFGHAKRAVEAAGICFQPWKETSAGRGRPQEDLLLLPEDAKVFAAQAGTDVGRQIAQVIVEHHNAYQRIREGDVTELLHATRNDSRPGVPMVEHIERRFDASGRLLEETIKRRFEAPAKPTPPRRPQLSIAVDRSDQLELVRRRFDQALNLPAMEQARQFGMDLDASKIELNQWCKGVAGKKRDNWTLQDFAYVVEMLDSSRGVDIHRAVFAAGEHLAVGFELNYCAHCGTKSYSETCPTCATAREGAEAC